MAYKAGVTPLSFAAIFGGTLTPLLFAVAIISDGNWTFDVNSLSDLGISKKETVALLFNSTCIVSGLCTSIFGFGKVMMSNKLDAASGVLMGFSGVFLLLVGVFTKADLEAHLTVAVTYFLLNALAIMVSMVSDYRKNRFFMFSFNIILILIVIAATFGYTYKGEEVVYVLLTCAWCMVQGLSLAFSKHYNTESDNRMVIR